MKLVYQYQCHRQMENLENPHQRTKAILSVLQKPTKLTFGRCIFAIKFCFLGKYLCLTLQWRSCYYRALQESADRLKISFEALGPQGGYLSTNVARDVLVRTGLEKDQLRLIWNLSDIDRDGLFDHDEYVVAMFLCDAVIQKGRPIPTELPATVIPPSKRELIAQRKKAGF
jgi:Cytoskeletal-regulatory complex EF hand